MRATQTGGCREQYRIDKSGTNDVCPLKYCPPLVWSETEAQFLAISPCPGAVVESNCGHHPSMH